MGRHRIEAGRDGRIHFAGRPSDPAAPVDDTRIKVTEHAVCWPPPLSRARGAGFDDGVPPPVLHPERHLSHRGGWLRAAVLGANDGIVSVACLVIAVAAADASHHTVVLAGVAALDRRRAVDGHRRVHVGELAARRRTGRHRQGTSRAGRDTRARAARADPHLHRQGPDPRPGPRGRGRALAAATCWPCTWPRSWASPTRPWPGRCWPPPRRPSPSPWGR